MAADPERSDIEAFEALFDRNYGDVLAYAIRRCPSRQDAEDVVAETFATAWRRIRDVPDGDRARLWLFGTARLVRHNHHRSRRRQRLLHDRLQRWSARAASVGPDGSVVAHEGIRRAVDALSDDDREVLGLHAWEGLGAEEIAATLGTSVPAAWKRLQRARDRLARELARGDEPPSAATGRLSAPRKVTP